MLGGVAHVPANSRTRTEYNGLFEPLLMVSSDQGSIACSMCVRRRSRMHIRGAFCTRAQESCLKMRTR